MPRFKVVPNQDLPDADRCWGDDRYAIVDTRDDTVVAFDGGEPEDQYFCRSWAWVPRLLNQLDAENVRLKARLEELDDRPDE